MKAIFSKASTGKVPFLPYLKQNSTSSEQYSFDAWEKCRNTNNWSYTGVPTTFTFDRGYTGHEMLDAFGLINMNGRPCNCPLSLAR